MNFNDKMCKLIDDHPILTFIAFVILVLFITGITSLFFDFAARNSGYVKKSETEIIDDNKNSQVTEQELDNFLNGM